MLAQRQPPAATLITTIQLRLEFDVTQASAMRHVLQKNGHDQNGSASPGEIARQHICRLQPRRCLTEYLIQQQSQTRRCPQVWKKA